MANYELELQSKKLAKKYGLIPCTVRQDNILEYIKQTGHNLITNVPNIAHHVKDSQAGTICTMSICSYMNPETPNKRLALIHSTGTGKTRKSLLAALSYNRDITIVAVHNIQKGPFMNELSRTKSIKNIYPGFRKELDIVTCKAIATSVQKRDYSRLDFLFKNRVVILDEMHHVRSNGEFTNKNKRTPLFDSVVDVLSRYKDCIVFFLTATPLVDTSPEVYGMYKLLRGEEPPYNVSPSVIAKMLNGYISYLERKNLPSETKIVQCRMTQDGDQWRLYKSRQDDKTSVHSKTLAISRFVTNDDEGATEHTSNVQDIIGDLLQGQKFDSDEHRYKVYIDTLAHISIKMYMLITYLRQHPNEPHFVFDSWKKRGGVDRLVEVLSMPAIGYSIVTSEQDVYDKPAPRMLVLHKLPQQKNTPSLVNKLRDIYNSPKNRDGSLIHLLIATPKFSESMSILTAPTCHILSIHWNKTGLIQVQGRINRKDSLTYLPKELRKVTYYIYVLFKPDKSATIESYLMKNAEDKYLDIFSLIKIFRVCSIEQLYTPDCNNAAKVEEQNCKINYRMRFCSPTISYRDIQVDKSLFLSKLENFENIYDTMYNIVESEGGFTRLLSIAIQSLELLYLKKLRKETITTKQYAALEDMRDAFMEIGSMKIHMLYFANNDTVEYQSLSSGDKRVVRYLDEDAYCWRDLGSKDKTNEAAIAYSKKITDFSESIKDKWIRYDFYATRHILFASDRLVKYKSEEDTSRQSSSTDIDLRKVSRGEKWVHYNKSVLLNLLGRLCQGNKYAMSQYESICRQKKIIKVGTIFQIIMSRMRQENMILVLPI